MKLSLLVCHLPEREKFLLRLKRLLMPQIEKFNGEVELLLNDADRSMPTGTKRNILKNQANGEYFSFIDVDDVVPMYYVHEIMTALKQNPDCVTFCGSMTVDGKKDKPFVIKLGSEYVTRDNCYYRFPNHLCAMKKSLVHNITFPDTWMGEDYEWAKKIHDRKILKTEVHLPFDMYTYEFINRKPKNKRP